MAEGILRKYRHISTDDPDAVSQATSDDVGIDVADADCVQIQGSVEIGAWAQFQATVTVAPKGVLSPPWHCLEVQSLGLVFDSPQVTVRGGGNQVSPGTVVRIRAIRRV